ncbi:MAG TPA: DUF5615 family PIN-like protein [Pirellulales bacterium]|nr:DUF5615 family PIN-like protein [Pirellulales bacterium]
MARFYANENFPFPIVEELRRLGHDALTVAETGKASQKVTDEEVLDFAISNSRAVLTLNRRHFIRLHGQRVGHAGIVVCTYDPDFVAVARRIHAAISGASEFAGQLIRITRPAR